ncbi:MAG TPA: hypothetical protein VF268_02960 [Gammaproteobacteria bacterium]
MLKNPGDYYTHPEEILEVNDLNTMQKREILKSWVAKAIAEIMQGGDKKSLRDVLKVLLMLDVVHKTSEEKASESENGEVYMQS